MSLYQRFAPISTGEMVSPANKSKNFICSAKRLAFDLLRGHPQIAKYLNGGVIYVRMFVYIYEKTFNIKVTPELLNEFVDGKKIGYTDETRTYVHALYGYSGQVLYKMFKGEFIPYDGRPDIFCFTHTSHEGLGVINAGRKMNVLFEPQFLRKNNGVKAFVSVKTLTNAGIELWYNARFPNRIFCFDPEMRDHVTKFEYSDYYLSDIGLKTVHAKYISSLLPKMKDDNENALKYIKKMIITDEEDTDED